MPLLLVHLREEEKGADARLSEVLSYALDGYASVLLFLLLAAVLSIFLTEQTDHTLMELLTVGGCGTLVWKNLLDFTAVF